MEQQPASTDGRYQTYVGGYYAGTGSSTVGGNAVSIQATVTAGDGTKGAFAAPNLVLNGDHFGGQGTAIGTAVTLTGRIDGYSQDQHFIGARILLFYTDAAGHHGRVAGVIVP